MTSRKQYSRVIAMAAKRDTDEFQRMHRTVKDRSWDDDEADPDASTYAMADHGPDPVPDWVITSDEARQTDLGILKTGKEADVHLVERRHGDLVNVLAAKRYRKLDERLFRNDSRYRAGRRTGDRRIDKAMEENNRAGKAFRARQWLATEFEVLGRLWAAGVPVPYPVQKLDNEVMLELIGTPEMAAPRLVHAGLDRADLQDVWDQLVDAMHVLVRLGVVHGDLSPYNLLVDDGRLVIIDFPQAVDPIGHPEGMALLERDVVNVCDWFGRRGVECDPSEMVSSLLAEAVGR